MTMPGFNAEAALSASQGRYHASVGGSRINLWQSRRGVVPALDENDVIKCGIGTAACVAKRDPYVCLAASAACAPLVSAILEPIHWPPLK